MKHITQSQNRVLDELNESWLTGKYPNGAINAAYSTILVTEAIDGEDFFVQGSDADEFISQIHQIWINGELTQSEAFTAWINMNF
jgi:hypothetical protein